MIICLFIFGTIFGSFMNVCIYRLPKKKSIVTPGSHCPSCQTPIKWYDNIPLLSFLILGGKCRACKAKISPRYVLVEILAGVAAVALFQHFGLTPKFFILYYFMSALIVASFIDFAIQEIPDAITLPGIALGLCVSFLHMSFFDSLLGVIAGGGSIYAMGFVGEFIFKKEAMGGGDVKLMAMVGAFIGWKLVLFAFFLAPFFGSIVGIILKLKEGRDIIPYGPYLSLASVVALFWGDVIVRRLFLI